MRSRQQNFSEYAENPVLKCGLQAAYLSGGPLEEL